ncbi:MAG: hypothetical protein ICV83_28965 [Cytophagales bacterium]|nr:hypothetical protein [Cytophagales bacterium]
MRHRFTLFGALPVLLLLGSCSHKFYAPNTHAVPLFQQQGEVRASGMLWTGTEVNGVELQGAYALTNHLGMVVNVIAARGGEVGDARSGYGYLLEAGSGYFRPLGEYGVFEAYGGLGVGQAKNRYHSDRSVISTANSTVGLVRVFGQPSIGLTTPYFDAAFSTRVAWLSMHNPRETARGAPAFSGNYEWEYMRLNPNSLLFEPAATLRAGWKYCKLQLQMGVSVNVTHPEFPQETLNMSIGLYLSLADKYAR